MPHLLSIQVGRPGTRIHEGHEWSSGIFKSPVVGAVRLDETNLDGDEQADLKNHGGPEKAVLMYSAEHYPFWQERLGRALPKGAFGENLTVSGFAEESLHIGDVIEVGECLLQVTQPRIPCFKLSRRNGIDDLAEQVMANGKGGWYVRVLRTGIIQADVPVRLVETRNLNWTVLKAFRLLIHDEGSLEETAELAGLSELAESWKRMLAKRLNA